MTEITEGADFTVIETEGRWFVVPRRFQGSGSFADATGVKGAIGDLSSADLDLLCATLIAPDEEDEEDDD